MKVHSQHRMVGIVLYLNDQENTFFYSFYLLGMTRYQYYGRIGLHVVDRGGNIIWISIKSIQ